MSRTAHLKLFEGYGIEAEYMIVDKASLAVRPIADRVLAAAGRFGGEALPDDAGEIEFVDTGWSNELVLHVVEMKTNGPTADLAGLDRLFQRDVGRLNEILGEHGAMLMPTAMHPLMRPLEETRLWPHGNAEIYSAYDRVFGCKGHGWSNLQSVHINLPFANDDEFGRLHAAIRLVLPILPALAASSPIFEGKLSGLLDNRLEFYRHNQRRLPLVAGQVVPEPAFSRAQYDEMIFQKIFAQIAPHDVEGILQHEWLNSRGAIARWDRHAIEIRLLDIQESPRADLAIVTTVVSLVKSLAEGFWVDLDAQMRWPTEPLAALFVSTLKDADRTPIADEAYLRLFGLARSGHRPVTAGDLWRHIATKLLHAGAYPLAAFEAPLMHNLDNGCLARRITSAVAGPDGREPVTRERIEQVYRKLCATLAGGGLFSANV